MRRAISTDQYAEPRETGAQAALEMPRRLRCALGLTLLLAASAQAHLPELFGRDYVLAPPVGTPESSGATPDNDEVIDAQRLDEALQALEARDGPYGAALSDPLTQLAAVQMRAGNTVDALRSYERALHVLRINNGLLHPAQIPLLRALAEVYAAIEDRRSAQAAHRHVLRIHGLATEPLHDEALEHALAYFQAARDAFIDPTLAHDRRLFLEAFGDNEQLWKVQLENSGDDYPGLLAVGLSQLRNLYVVTGTDIASGQFGAADVESDLLLRQQSLSLGKGLKILDTLLERLPEPFASSRAQLLLARGNWQQWNGRWRSARSDYAALEAALGDSEADRALRERLAAPAELPEDPPLWRSLQQDHIPRRAVVRASFRVSPRGDASRVQAAVEGSGHPVLAGQLRRMIIDTHFRPAVVDGEARVADVDGRRYLLLD